MKNYRAMRFVSGVLQLLGWLTLILGCLFAFGAVQMMINLPSDVRGRFGDATLVGGIGMILTGVFIVAVGQAISAIADMATNSWHLRELVENSRRSAGQP